LWIGPAFDLPLERATKLSPDFPVSDLPATINVHFFKNMNRRTADQGTAEYRREKLYLILSKTSAVRNSVFDIRYSTPRTTLFTQRWFDQKWVNYPGFI
jgi:hypothetical protein